LTVNQTKRISNSSSSLISRLCLGITWNLIASVFNQGNVFVINIIIARLLGKTLFGEYTIIQSTLLTASLLAQFSTGITATRYLAAFRDSDRERAGRILGLCALVSAGMGAMAVLLLFISAPWLSTEILKAPHLSVGLRIGGGFLFFAIINGFQIGALAGLENYRNLAKAGLFNSCLMLSICTVATWKWGVNGALAGLAISAMVNWLIHQHFLRAASREQGIFFSHRGLWRERRALTKFALPAALSGFVSMPAFWLANVLLVRCPNGFSEMALYSASMNIRTIYVLLPRNINNVSFSILNNYRGMGNQHGYSKTFWLNMCINGLLALVVGLAIYLIGPKLLGLFGKTFEDASNILFILILSGFIEIIAISIYQVIQTKGKIWTSLFIIVIPQHLAMIVLAYFLTPTLGGTGLAMAFSVGWGVQLVVNSFTAWSLGLRLNE
jgi:O-antigen/teichoic acid export membrane protein